MHRQVPATLHQLLTEAAQREPDREAVCCGGRSLSYRELDVMSSGLAGQLVDAGIRRGDRVGILLPKGVESVASVYGAMKSGAAYVPLDPQAPARRSGMAAADCAVGAVITTPGRAAALLEAMEGHRPKLVILVDDGSEPAHLPCPAVDFPGATSASTASDRRVPTIELDLAYILYTSGSTGVPKGVMLTHRNALTFVEWCASRIGIGREDRVANHAPLHFDLSVLDLYLAALGAATVVVVPQEDAYFGSALAQLIERERITVWYSVPSALMLLTRAVPDPRRLTSLRAVVFAGEVYPTRQLRELQKLVPHAELWNLYGPTETNVVTYHRVAELPADDRTIPIGRACENGEVFALREDGSRSDVGEEGELFVRGPTVMKGYWNRPEKTSEVLVPNPLDPMLGDRVYRTGDIVRLRADGDYDFLGRRDHQIKSRGYRIELGEIEAVVGAHPAVEVAVAVPVPHPQWNTAIVACVQLGDGKVVSEREMKRYVAKQLPRYMVPTRIEIMEALPRTSTGKIDRQVLLQQLSRGGGRIGR